MASLKRIEFLGVLRYAIICLSSFSNWSILGLVVFASPSEDSSVWEKSQIRTIVFDLIVIVELLGLTMSEGVWFFVRSAFSTFSVHMVLKMNQSDKTVSLNNIYDKIYIRICFKW